MRFIVIISIFLFTILGCAQETKIFPQTKIPYAPRSYVCYKTASAVKIDGILEETTWNKASWSDYFVDIEGSIKPNPTYKTRIKMLWDDLNFYFAAEVEDPHVWAKLIQRDTVIFYDNDFEIFIDPDGDTHNYFELELNAFGTEWDLLLTKPYRDGAVALNSFDLKGLQSAVSVQGTINNPQDTDEGWTVEVLIPWKAFSDCANQDLPPKPQDQWRINFSRVQWRTEIENDSYKKVINPSTGRPFPEDNWVWSPQGLIAMHAPETWGWVQFSKYKVGTETEKFIVPENDAACWVLRKLYYSQRTFHLNNGVFTNNINDLDFLGENLEKYNWPPKIYITPTTFEAILEKKDGEKSWHILQDGKIWQQLNNHN